MGKRFNNRAVSQVIAALLLIAIAVAAAVLVYVFSIGLLGSLQGGGGQQVKQQLIMEAYSWLPPLTASPILTIRNVGTASITVADVFVNGIAVTTPTVAGGTGCGTPALSVPLQTTCTLTWSGFGAGTFGATATAPTAGVAYAIKVVTADGAVFSYAGIAGQAS